MMCYNSSMGKLKYAVRTITCKGCGKTVTQRMPSRQEYCTHACYLVSDRPWRKTGRIITCENCGKPVYKPATQLKHEHSFCGLKCANEWQGRNKTEHTCKICGKTFRWSPSRTASGKYNVTYCSLACRDADPLRREMLIAITAKQQLLHPNGVEKAGYAILDSLSVDYLPQHLIGGKFCADAFVSSTKTVIQFDGDYWHGNPVLFPNPDKRQVHRMALDRSQDAYMTTCGYTVIRLWASDIKRQPEAVKARLQQLLAPQ